MRRFICLLALPILAAVVSCAPAEPPRIPSWDEDVYPILRGNCAHCHGAAVRPDTSPTSRYDICTSTPFNMAFASEQLWITGADAMGRPLEAGASKAAGTFALFTGPDAQPSLRMPPPPASPLTEYELTVLGRWATAGKASCAKKEPNRKPTARIVTAAAQVPGTNRVAVTVEVSDPDGDQVFGYVKMGNAPLRVVTGSGRARYEYDGVRVNDTIVIKLHDGWDVGP
jgi:hypothetical protein